MKHKGLNSKQRMDKSKKGWSLQKIVCEKLDAHCKRMILDPQSASKPFEEERLEGKAAEHRGRITAQALGRGRGLWVRE